jgi:glycosyltransferase involved in cell wall biosynthesis
MKIGIISIIREPWGGSEELWCSTVEAGLERGYHAVHSLYDFKDFHTKEKGLQNKGLVSKTRRGFVQSSQPVSIRRIRKVINFALDIIDPPLRSFFQERPDVILYVGTGQSALETSGITKALLKSGIPYCINVQLNNEGHQLLTSAQRTTLKYFFQNAKKIFWVSRRNWEMLECTLATKLSNSIVVRNPVNLSGTSLVKFPESKSSCHFAVVGNLIVAHKGQDILFKVLSMPFWSEIDWHLNVYGEGIDKEYLHELVHMYGLTERVTFQGRVDDIRELWQNNHLLIMPSVMEGMALAVVEAMLCGRPVVATDVGGHAEWIDDNVNGFLAAASTLNALQDALERAWERRSDWEHIGKLAHEKAMQLYDPTPGKTLLHLLEQVAGKKG